MSKWRVWYDDGKTPRQYAIIVYGNTIYDAIDSALEQSREPKASVWKAEFISFVGEKPTRESI